jgi:hypothetical protein
VNALHDLDDAQARWRFDALEYAKFNGNRVPGFNYDRINYTSRDTMKVTYVEDVQLK